MTQSCEPHQAPIDDEVDVISVEEYCAILVEVFVDITLKNEGVISEVKLRKMRHLVL